MTVVIDVGCATHPGQDSVTRLRARFRPVMLYGFDPFLEAGVVTEDSVLLPLAVWTHSGTVGFQPDVAPTRSRVEPLSARQVPCVDLAVVVTDALDVSTHVVLKLDCEGGEYPLLQHLADTGLDSEIAVVLVEWHSWVQDHQELRASLESRLACRIEEWT